MFECNCTHVALYAHYGKLYVCTVSDYDRNTFSLLLKLTGKGKVMSGVLFVLRSLRELCLLSRPLRLVDYCPLPG